MANEYFTKTGNPSPNAPGSSTSIRNEFSKIDAGFAKLPILRNNAGKLVVVNPDSTTLETTSNPANLAIIDSAIDNTSVGLTTPAPATVTNLTVSGTANLGSVVVIGGGIINGTPIGLSQAVAGAFSTLSASSGYTGNVTGNVAGDLVGSVTGDLAGNVTANAGITTLCDVTINGTLNMSSGTIGTITGLSDPVYGSDAANKVYVDSSIATVVGSAPETLNALNELAQALGNDPSFAATTAALIGTKLALSGGTMSGQIEMGANKITGLLAPSSGDNATNKTYVDARDALKLALSGGTMSGQIAMGANKITGLAEPTLAQDAVTKNYIDVLVLSNVHASKSAADAALSEAASANSAINSANSATASAGSALISSGRAVDAANLAAAALISEQAAQSSAIAAATSTASAVSSSVIAVASATTATTQASLATTNGAAQVALATAQVNEAVALKKATSADVVSTRADVVSTHADKAVTGANVALTQADVAAAGGHMAGALGAKNDAISAKAAAQAAQAAAETAAEIAAQAANIYASISLGLAATAPGGYFSVAAEQSTLYFPTYQNVNGVAAFVASGYAAAKVDEIEAASTLSAASQAAGLIFIQSILAPSLAFT